MKRPLAASVLAVLALTACSKRGCACLAGYAPEIAATEIDPLEITIYEPTKQNLGRLFFALGEGPKDVCPRLPETTSITLNGVRGNIDSLGGATGMRIAETACRRAEVNWSDVPLAALPSSKIVVDDGSSKLECTLALGLPLVVAAGALEGMFIERAASIAVEDGPGTALQATNVASDGKRLTLPVPTSLLRPGKPHRLDLTVTIESAPNCVPARKTPPKAHVMVTSTHAFDVD